MGDQSRRVFRQIIRVLPVEFRQSVGTELEDVAIACLDRERARLGWFGAAVAWMRILADTLTAAVALLWLLLMRGIVRDCPGRLRMPWPVSRLGVRHLVIVGLGWLVVAWTVWTVVHR